MSREAVIDFDNAPVVLVERHWTDLIWNAGALCFLLTLDLAFDTYRAPPGAVVDRVEQLKHLLPMVILAAALLRGLVLALQPARLTLGPEGLRSDRWFRSRTWRWDEISDIRWRKDNRIEFRSDGRRIRLPTGAVSPAGWRDKPVSEGRLAIVIRNAQARWA